MIRIRLSRLLGEKKMTQVELSRKTGVRKATINELYWELCDYVKLETIDKICHALNCKVYELLENESDNERKKNAGWSDRKKGVIKKVLKPLKTPFYYPFNKHLFFAILNATFCHFLRNTTPIITNTTMISISVKPFLFLFKLFILNISFIYDVNVTYIFFTILS